MKQLIPKNKQKLIYIKWQDAHANGGWFTHDGLTADVNKQMWVVEEIGWIVFEDDKEIHLVARRGTWEGNGTSEYGSYQRIPKAWILKKKVMIR